MSSRIWNLKLREHKIDIERAMLFGQQATVGGIQYTEGIAGHIIKNGTAVVDDSALSYSSGAPYFRSAATSELTYDRILSDFEVVYDPARGGSDAKLALASLPVITFSISLVQLLLLTSLLLTNFVTILRNQ